MRRDELEAWQAKVSELRSGQNKEQSVRPQGEQPREGIEGTSLENAPDVGQPFQEVGGEARQTMGNKAGIGSEQVKDSGQNHDMKPPPETAEESDRQRHTDEMGKDQERAEQARMAAIQDRMKALDELKESRGMDKEKDQGQDKGYEMG